MIDGFDIVGGEGPMAPTRSGSVAVADLLRYAQGKDLERGKECLYEIRWSCQPSWHIGCP